MKSYQILIISLILFFVSCRNNEPASIADSTTNLVSDATSDSFKLKGSYSFNSMNSIEGAEAGFFLDVNPGISQLVYDTLVGLTDITSAEGIYEHAFMNIDAKNERIYPVGTTVYCRAFIRSNESIVLGDEISFKIPEAEYTIMVYGIGGGNLDADIAYKTLIPMMLSGRDGKVEVTFQFKPSAVWQSSSDMKMKGVHRWVMPYEGEFSKIWDDQAVKYDIADEEPYVKYAYGKIVNYSKSIAGADLNMSDPKNLASFIDWSKEVCPAKHYILLMSDHGEGWDFYSDGSSCVETKSQFSDDNLNYQSTSLIDFIAGIKASSVGKLSAVIFAECVTTQDPLLLLGGP